MIPVTLIAVAIINVLIICSYVIFQLSFRKQKSELRKMVMGFVAFIMGTGIFLMLSFISYYFSHPSTGYFKLLAMECAIYSLFFLNRYGRIIMELQSSFKHNVKLYFFFIGLPFIVSLPQNQWEALNFAETIGFPLQPISTGLIIVLATHIFILSIIRSRHARDKIMDPALKETYSWMYKGLWTISSSLVPLCFTIIYFFTPPESNMPVIIGTIVSFVLASIGMFYGIMAFYIGMTFPKPFLGQLYSKYVPMWLELNNIEEYELQLKKLKENLFD